MGQSLRLQQVGDIIRLVERDHDATGVDYHTLVVLSPLDASIAMKSGVSWVHEPSIPLPPAPDDSALILVPSPDGEDWHLSVWDGTRLINEGRRTVLEYIQDLAPYLEKRTDIPGRTMKDIQQAKAKALLARAAALQSEANVCLAQAQALLETSPA